MPSFPGLDVPLSDGVVALRLSAERDIPDVLIAYQDDPCLPAALGEERPPSGAALGSRAERAPVAMATGQEIVFSILQAGTDTCRGEVRVSEVDWPGGRAQLRVWVAPGFRGRGWGPRALDLASRWLTDRCSLQASCRGA